MSGAPKKVAVDTGQNQRKAVKVMTPIKGQLTPTVTQNNIILRYPPNPTHPRTILIAPKPAGNVNIAPKPAAGASKPLTSMNVAPRPAFILTSPGTQFQNLAGQNVIFKTLDNKPPRLISSEKIPAQLTKFKTTAGQKIVLSSAALGQNFVLQNCSQTPGRVTFKLQEPKSPVQACKLGTEIKEEPSDEPTVPRITSIMGDLQGKPFILRPPPKIFMKPGLQPPPLAPISRASDSSRSVLLPRIPTSQIITPKVPLIAKRQAEKLKVDEENAKKQRTLAPKPYIPVARMCRVCGTCDQPMVAIFSTQGAKLCLAEKIGLHLPIEVSKADRLPLKVCELCITRLNMCYEMSLHCVETNNKLTKQLHEEDRMREQEEAKKAAGKEPIPLLLIEGGDTPLEPSEGEQKGSSGPSPKKNKLRVITDKLVSVDKNLPQPEQIAQVIEAVKAGLGTQQSVSLDTLFKSVVQKGIQSSDQPSESTPDTQSSKYKCKLCKEKLPNWFTLIEHQLLKFRCRTCSARFCSMKQRKIHHTKKHRKTHFGCQKCSKKFGNKKELLKHKLKYHAINCECCGKNFADRAKIMSHIKNKLKGKYYKCNECGKECINRKRYIHHIESNQCIFRDKGEVFQCKECKRHFSTDKRLEEHKKLHQPEFPKFVCNICGKLFMTPFTLKRHSIFHADKPFECNICSKKFTMGSQLKYHMEVHENAYKYQCNFCGRKLLHRVHLIKHMRTLHLEKIEYQCVICNLLLPEEKEMLSHVSKEHSKNEKMHTTHVHLYRKITEHQCKECKKYLGSRAGLIRHVKIHEDNGSVCMFICEICGKNFKSRSGLYHHRKVHTGVGTCKNGSVDENTGYLKRYQCSYCNNKFATTSQLKAHISKHTGIKPYTCSYCDLSFTTKQSVHQHELRHTGHKRHTCEICKKGFYEKNSLTCHMRTHTRHAPYKCKVCNKTFLRRSNLTTHLRVHTGEKPYVCPVCSHSFTQKCSLDKHMCIHTQQKLYKCAHCSFSCDRRKTMTEHEITQHNVTCDRYGVKLAESEESTRNAVSTILENEQVPVSYEIHIVNEEEVGN